MSPRDQQKHCSCRLRTLAATLAADPSLASPSRTLPLRCEVLLAANVSMLVSSESRNSRKLTPFRLQVSQMLKRTRYSRNPFSVADPLMISRNSPNARIAFSALLLFHGDVIILQEQEQLAAILDRSLFIAESDLRGERPLVTDANRTCPRRQHVSTESASLARVGQSSPPLA